MHYSLQILNFIAQQNIFIFFAYTVQLTTNDCQAEQMNDGQEGVLNVYAVSAC